MTHNSYTPELQRFDELASAYCDERLSEGEWTELETLLWEQPALRRRFQEWMTVHGQLAWAFGGNSGRLAETAEVQTEMLATSGASVSPSAPAGSARRKRLAMYAAGFVSTAAALFVAVWLSQRGPNPDVNPAQPVVQLVDQDRPVIAKLVELTGEAELVSSSGTALPAVADQEIRLDQTLRTVGDEGFAVVEYADGTRIELSPDTELQFVSYQPEGSKETGKKLVLRKGVLRAEVAKQPVDRPMLLATQFAQMRVLGTTFTFGVSDNASRVDLEEGRVQFTRQSDGQTVDVEQGYYAVASAAEPLVAKPLPKAVAFAQTRIKPNGGHSAVLSADGAQLATLRRNQVQIWDSHTGNRRGSLDQRHAKGTRLVFLPDNRRVAIVGYDGSVALWDLDSKNTRRRFALDGLPAVAFSPDGKSLAAVGRTAKAAGVVHRWDIATGNVLPDLHTTAPGIASLAYSPDGKLLALGTTDGRALVWDVAADSQVASFSVGAGYVTGLAYSPDGRWLAAIRRVGGQLAVWDAVERGEPIHLTGHGQAIHAVAFSAHGEFLAAGTHDGNVTLWNPQSRKEVLWLHPAGQAVLSLAFTPDGNALLTAANSGLIEFWRTPRETKSGE